MTGELWVVLAVAWPLVLAATVALRRSIALHPAWSWVVCLAPLPALVAAIGVSDAVSVELTWLLLGSRWEIDSTRQALLVAAALVWLLAGWHMRERFRRETHRTSLQLGWLLALTGNVGVMVVHDVAGLYSFFALMSFSAYPLVVLARTPEALTAGRVYLTMTVIGEVLILTGLLIATRGLVSPQLSDLASILAESPHAAIACLCLWTGFGVKTAVAGVHMWLPGAYTHAPPPVSAVLGGAMINAGVLGLLVTLPLGVMTLPTLGTAIVGTGLLGAFGAAFVGVTQRATTTVLGYSSISQMGLLMIPLGASLHTPAIAPAAVAAVTLFAVHHGLVKASLFLGVDVARGPHAPSRTLLLSLLLLVGASLSGAPLTSGAAAKLATKHALADIAATWPWLVSAFSLAAAGTTVLVLRALWCLARELTDRASHRATARATGAATVTHSASLNSSTPWPVSWLLSVSLVLTGVWWLPLAKAAPAWPGTSTDDAISLLWPIMLGVAMAGAATWASARPRWPRWRVPAGDVLIPLTALVGITHAWVLRTAGSLERVLQGNTVQRGSEGAQDSGLGIAPAWHRMRTHLHVKQPARVDSALRSAAPIVFGALIVAAFLLLRR